MVLTIIPLFRGIGCLVNAYLFNFNNGSSMERVAIKQLTNIMYFFDGLTYLFLAGVVTWFANRFQKDNAKEGQL